ncbi:shieldin complex subunit 3 [Ctenopharyngodon idella]|uniref:shieldin complex subunit 3 n=1 Tax=Ctenopharyngodon idella TaxID=7959 RepID=UPI00223045FC|nr:shieldin complex subunit 3 [Ctenopharyngodon idella]
MSQEMKDVSVYFRPPLEVRDVVFLTHRVLQEFPSTILPEFRPWYPSASDTRKPIRPQKPPPLISSEEPQEIPLRPEEHQDASDARAERKLESEPKRFKRSWCVITDRTTPLKITHSFSRLFRKTIEKHGLDLHQRVKWVVCERNCGALGVEELWLELNRAIRRSRLPTCNANFQRALAQIWLYCDVFYCEYIGNFLKQEFQLSGQITLTAHKLGDIIKL